MAKVESELQKVEQLLGFALPEAYRRFAVAAPSGAKVRDKEKGTWILMPVRDLLASCRVDGRVQPKVRILAGYVATLREVMGQATVDQDGNEFELDRLAACVAIGSENTETLFLDPSDGFSVWCFYPAGGDVERLATSFEDWLGKHGVAVPGVPT